MFELTQHNSWRRGWDILEILLDKALPENCSRTSLSGGRLILPERLGNGLSGTGGPLVSESVSLAEDCDRSGTATSVDGTPCTEDEHNSLFR
ncbi:hypothetical protein TNCV_3453461 [Trichonephila clavipes]|nr:hypothetical protein TNCV_3453461 [Trichonephila clavipes]